LLSLTQNNPIIHQIEGHLWMISLLTIVYGEVMAVVKICPSDLHQILAKKKLMPLCSNGLEVLG